VWTRVRTKGEAPPARFAHSATLIEEDDCRMVVFGGWGFPNDASVFYGDCWLLNLDRMEWNREKVEGRAPSEKGEGDDQGAEKQTGGDHGPVLFGHGSVLFGKHLLFLCGHDGSMPRNDVHVLNIARNEEEEEEEEEMRCGHTGDGSKVDNSPRLGTDLRELRHSGRFSDLTLRAGGVAFPVHRAILAARGPVFERSLCNGIMLESRSRDVEIGDMQADVFDVVLDFVYSDRLDLKPEQIDGSTLLVDVLVASDRYQLTRLRSLTEEYLMDAITIENCVDLLCLAHRHHAPSLLKASTVFAVHNWHSVQKSFADAEVPADALNTINQCYRAKHTLKRPRSGADKACSSPHLYEDQDQDQEGSGDSLDDV